MVTESNSEGGWPGGWLVAVVAGVVSAILARWIGDVGMAAAVLVGIFVFLVFGVLLGMFWAAPAVEGHGGHDHGPGHGDGHGHTPEPVAAHVAESAPVAAKVVDSAPVVARVAEPAPVAAPVAAPQSVAAPVLPEPVAEPAPQPAVVASVVPGGVRPAALPSPRGGVADPLQTIEGIGPALEKLCHELGIYHFDQIAGWGVSEVAWMDGNLKGFKGRVTRDRWVRQAGLIGEVGKDEFLRRAKKNDY